MSAVGVPVVSVPGRDECRECRVGPGMAHLDWCLFPWESARRAEELEAEAEGARPVTMSDLYGLEDRLLEAIWGVRDGSPSPPNR